MAIQPRLAPAPLSAVARQATAPALPMAAFLNATLPTAARLAAALVTAALVTAAAALLAPQAWAQDGAALAQKVYDRPDGDDAVSAGEMVLTEKGKSPRTRKMMSFGKDNAAGDAWSLIRFDSPADVKGTGLLSHDLANGAEDQWVYLPALKRSRRIPSGRKGGRFVGSDLFYEDLQDRKPSEDNHTILGKDEVNGAACTLLESVPKEKKSSVYKKKVSCIHDDLLLALRVDYFQKGDKPSKRYEARRIKKVQGYWTVMESVVTDMKSGHSTAIKTSSITYDKGLPMSLFSQASLEDPSLESDYR